MSKEDNKGKFPALAPAPEDIQAKFNSGTVLTILGLSPGIEARTLNDGLAVYIKSKDTGRIKVIFKPANEEVIKDAARQMLQAEKDYYENGYEWGL